MNHIMSINCTPLEFTDNVGNTIVRKNQGLLVEKCRFLEQAGCVRTCLHACKIPTQRYILVYMSERVMISIIFLYLSCPFTCTLFRTSLCVLRTKTESRLCDPHVVISLN